MSLKVGTLALAAGLAAFFAVAVGVTAITVHWTEAATFLGLIAGSIAGLGVSVGVAAGLDGDVSPGRRRTAGTVVGFALAFVLALGGAITVVELGVGSAVVVAFVAALLVAAGVRSLVPVDAADPDA